MQDDYQINEKDIQAVIHFMEIHDPKNADRDYAIQFLESMQGSAGEVARTTEGVSPEQIQQAFDKKDNQD